MACASSCTCHDCASPTLPGVFAALMAPAPTPADDAIARMWADTEARQTRGFGALEPREPHATPAPAWRPQPVALAQAGASVNLRSRRDSDDTFGSRQEQLPSGLSGGSDTDFPPTSSAQDACPWEFIGFAAPLIDPLRNTRCRTEANTGWRLLTTNVSTLRLTSGETRLFFQDGRLTGDWAIPWPDRVTAQFTGNPVFKFGLDNNSMPLRNEFELHSWWAAHYTEGMDIRELHFSSRFIAFLDSPNGVTFPLYAPIVDNLDRPFTCDFSAITPTHQTTNFRSGWRSTVIPCAGESIVYKSDSVLGLFLNGQVYYVMFAVQCSGVAQGTTKSDLIEEPGCSLCEPGFACRTRYIPTTQYVFFVSESPDFQAGVMGPFTLLQNPPNERQREWIGVPQTFLSPDRDFIFFYFHPQPYSSHQQYGLNIARLSDFRAGLRRILATNPRRSNNQGLPQLDAAEQELGTIHVAQTFVNLGPLTFCPEHVLQPNNLVDEHFVFCSDRLHLYFTSVTRNRDGESWLRDIWHFEADLDLDVASLNTFIHNELPASAAATSAVTLDRVRRCTGRFHEAGCKVAFDMEQHLGADHAVNIDNNTSEWVSLNDPSVYPRLGTFTNTEPMAMLFHSSSLRGLVVARTANPCEPGECPTISFPGSSIFDTKAPKGTDS